jgi:hypothetical protein
MSEYTMNQLRDHYSGFCSKAIARCRFTRELIGGQPASEDGVRAFCQHHLEIPEGPDLESAIKRILKEEVGERDVTPENGEVKERESYGLKVLRHDDFGPWIGDWQIKAALKQAASRVGLFVSKRGSKGDVAEMGKVTAHGISLHGPEFHIHLMDQSGEKPATTGYRKFMGNVASPNGRVNIVHDSECAPEGTTFEFMFQWYRGKLGEEEVVAIFSALPVVGVGSVKAMECGKFDIEHLEVKIKPD